MNVQSSTRPGGYDILSTGGAEAVFGVRNLYSETPSALWEVLP